MALARKINYTDAPTDRTGQAAQLQIRENPCHPWQRFFVKEMTKSFISVFVFAGVVKLNQILISSVHSGLKTYGNSLVSRLRFEAYSIILETSTSSPSSSIIELISLNFSNNRICSALILSIRTLF
jgi:hypothetical protein